MCIQITATLPIDTKLEHIKRLIAENDFEFSTAHNETIIAQLPKDEVYYKVTKWACDCNTGLNSYKIYYMDFKSNIKANIDNFDETFINNLRQDFINRNESYKKDAEKWENFIRSVLESNEVRRIGILIHFYQYSYEQEKFQIKQIKDYKENQLNLELLLRIEQVILYYFSK